MHKVSSLASSFRFSNYYTSVLDILLYLQPENET